MIKSSTSIGRAIAKIEVLEITTMVEKNGFLSGATKAKVEINGQIKDLFIKTIIGPEDPFRCFYDENNLDELEIRFYKEFLPTLICFSKEELTKNETKTCQKQSNN